MWEEGIEVFTRRNVAQFCVAGIVAAQYCAIIARQTDLKGGN